MASPLFSRLLRILPAGKTGQSRKANPQQVRGRQINRPIPARTSGLRPDFSLGKPHPKPRGFPDDLPRRDNPRLQRGQDRLCHDAAAPRDGFIGLRADRPSPRPSALRNAHICVAPRAPRERKSFSPEYQAVGRPFSTKWGRCRAKPDGWGVESRNTSSKVRSYGRAIVRASKRRAVPHPALRATFPSKLGKGSAPRFEMCECGSLSPHPAPPSSAARMAESAFPFSSCLLTQPLAPASSARST